LDFDFAADDEAFRHELRELLVEFLPDDWQGIFKEGDDAWHLSVDFCKELGRRGWLIQSWPEAYGGRATSVWRQAVVAEELWAFNEPRGAQYMNVNWIGPALMAFGSPDQQDELLPRLARGEMVWAQGFSEPEAGSDLASLRCRADPVEGGYVINGQKIWISYGDIADHCFLLCRTEAASSRKEGLSVLLVDLSLPGVTRRPIPTILGPHRQNELFFDDVHVPASARLGPEGDGWRVATTALAFERSGSARYARSARILGLLERSHGAAWDEREQLELARLLAFGRAAELVNYDVIAIKAKGVDPRAEASVARIYNSLYEQLLSDFIEDVLGLGTIVAGDDPASHDVGELEAFWRNAMAATITAGSYEVQMGIVGRTAMALGEP
jgi:alkylation response protein AidB-like acyl-CoA dehydrogenase